MFSRCQIRPLRSWEPSPDASPRRCGVLSGESSLSGWCRVADQGSQEGDVPGHGAATATDDAGAGSDPPGDVAPAGLGIEIMAAADSGLAWVDGCECVGTATRGKTGLQRTRQRPGHGLRRAAVGKKGADGPVGHAFGGVENACAVLEAGALALMERPVDPDRLSGGGGTQEPRRGSRNLRQRSAIRSTASMAKPGRSRRVMDGAAGDCVIGRPVHLHLVWQCLVPDFGHESVSLRDCPGPRCQFPALPTPGNVKGPCRESSWSARVAAGRADARAGLPRQPGRHP